MLTQPCQPPPQHPFPSLPAALGALTRLQDLAVIDSDWGSMPLEVCRLPLTRLYLRFADFEGRGWLPEEAVAAEPPPPTTPRLPAPIPTAGEAEAVAGSGPAALPAGVPPAVATSMDISAALASTAAGGSVGKHAAEGQAMGGLGQGKGPGIVSVQSSGLPCTLLALTLHGCQLSQLPPRFGKLTALRALCLDRNGSLQELPAGAVAPLRALRVLSLEGCRSVQSLGEGIPQLPLESLNIQVSRRCCACCALFVRHKQCRTSHSWHGVLLPCWVTGCFYASPFHRESLTNPAGQCQSLLRALPRCNRMNRGYSERLSACLLDVACPAPPRVSNQWWPFQGPPLGGSSAQP